MYFLQHIVIHICSALSLFDRLHQHPRLPWYPLHLAGQNIIDPDLLSVESSILIVPLDDDGPIELHAAIQPATLHVAEHRSPILGDLALHHASRTKGSSDHGDLSSERDANFREGSERFPVVDHEHAVVDVDAGHEAHPKGVDQNTGRCGPAPICLFGDQNAGATRAGDPEACPHDTEDGQAYTVLDYLLRDLD